MKVQVLLCVICVIFYYIASSVGAVFAFIPQNIDFSYENKIFTYSMENNICTTSQFDLKQKTSKFNRFGSNEDRIKLLQEMISIGISKDIALNYLFPNLNETISKIQKNINKKPQNASIRINESTNQVFFLTPEVVGTSLDNDTLIENLYNALLDRKPLNFEVPTIKTYPQTSIDDLKKFTNLRAEFSTSISSSSTDRKHNIKNALNSLNRIEIAPNEVFSFNKIVGKRTTESGYRQAKIIVNNEFVEGVGGGVCQVSSTLYNAALLAGLEIIEANKHSKQIGYVKAGFDAMVNFGSSDLRFRNNTNEKIIIITNYSNSTARIRIFGENNANVKFVLSNEISNIVEPTEEVVFDIEGKYLNKVKYNDEFFYLKSPSKGIEIKTYRKLYKNGELAETQLLRHDKFPVQNGIKVYGNLQRQTIKSNPEEHLQPLT